MTTPHITPEELRAKCTRMFYGTLLHKVECPFCRAAAEIERLVVVIAGMESDGDRELEAEIAFRKAIEADRDKRIDRLQTERDAAVRLLVEVLRSPFESGGHARRVGTDLAGRIRTAIDAAMLAGGDAS